MKFDHISEIFRLHCLSTVFRNFLKYVKTIEPKTYVMILSIPYYLWTKYQGFHFSNLLPIFFQSHSVYLCRVALKDSTKTKKNWDKVNLTINKNRPSSNRDNLTVKDKNVQQPSSLSNAFNRYFCKGSD